MRTFIPILIGAMLFATSLAKEVPSEPLPPTPPKQYGRALGDDDDLGPPPTCTANATYDTTELYGRNGLIDTRYRWKIMNIYIDPAITDAERQRINDALYTLWQVLPCLNFGVFPQGSSPWGDYVHIKKADACNSPLGRQGGSQIVNLEAPRCFSVELIMHEIMHALGVEHEHQRPDRDDFINIHWDNIKDGFAFAFEKQSPNRLTSYGVPYNPNSLMHYHSYSFSKNKLPTITDKSGRTINQAYVLQETDKQKLKEMYTC